MCKQIIIFFSIFFIIFNQVFANDEYFLTLRNDIVNLRQGPSFEYQIKIFYKKKYLPVLAIDKSDNFIKILDHENNSGWIHISQLSKKKAALNMVDQATIYKNSTVYSKPLVILEKGKLLLISKCKTDWCKVKAGKYKGWIHKKYLWGRL
jgi:SH3-like domain-containing protein